MAEEDRFDQILWNRPAIDGDERPPRAFGRALDRARNEFLTGARLALNQNGNIGLRGAAAEPKKDRKSTRLNSSHMSISYAVFCLKKKKNIKYKLKLTSPLFYISMNRSPDSA